MRHFDTSWYAINNHFNYYRRASAVWGVHRNYHYAPTLPVSAYASVARNLCDHGPWRHFDRDNEYIHGRWPEMTVSQERHCRYQALQPREPKMMNISLTIGGPILYSQDDNIFILWKNDVPYREVSVRAVGGDKWGTMRVQCNRFGRYGDMLSSNRKWKYAK